jgi:hypothetical protein
MRSIWAVAINTVKQALRMKVAVVFIVLLALMLGALGITSTGDGTLKGRLQTFVSYGLSLTSLLLCLLTIIITVYTLTNDIKQRQIYTVITKPVRRFELIAGKLLGVILLDTALLVLFSGVIYAITVNTPKFVDVSSEEIEVVRNEFFAARAALTPEVANVDTEVERRYQQLKRAGQLGEVFRGLSPKEIKRRLKMSAQLSKRAAPAGRQLIWEFENVKPLNSGESLFIRFKYDVSVNPPDQTIYSRWLIGDIRPMRYGGRPTTRIVEFDRKDLIRTFFEIEVPAEVIAEDGYLSLAFTNAPINNTVVIFPLEDGLEVLYKADTFRANYIRGVALILLRLIFLAVLSTMAATFLSFPVAILLCLVIFFTAAFSGFIVDSFYYLSDNLSDIYSLTFSPILKLLPQFDKFNPTTYLVSARLVSWSLLAEAIGLMICVKAVLLSLVALLIFHYKELAKITV